MAPRKPIGPLVDGDVVLTPKTRSTLPKSPTEAPKTAPTAPRATIPGRGIVPRTGVTIAPEDQPFTPVAGIGSAAGEGGKTPDTRIPVGTVDGVTYYDELAYATALADYNAGLRERRTAETERMTEEAAKLKQRVSAQQTLEAWLKTFFDANRDAQTITELMKFVRNQIEEDIPADAVMINIREQPFYQNRFAGNKGLRAAGMAELDPVDYLRAERQYADILNAANLNTLARQDTFASLIGGQVSATELEDRVTNVYQRIANADTALKEEMRRLKQLGNIDNADFAAALLTGKEGAASLRRKIAQAEISTEFTQRGLGSAIGIEELANLGITREQARVGSEFARAGTRRLTDLASIYGVQSAEIQKELEQEAFKGLESQRRKQLTAQERAAFAGSAGTGTPSLGSSAAGAI